MADYQQVDLLDGLISRLTELARQLDKPIYIYSYKGDFYWSWIDFGGTYAKINPNGEMLVWRFQWL